MSKVMKQAESGTERRLAPAGAEEQRVSPGAQLMKYYRVFIQHKWIYLNTSCVGTPGRSDIRTDQSQIRNCIDDL